MKDTDGRMPEDPRPAGGAEAAVNLMGVLEERVSDLVERYNGAAKTIEELQENLAESEARLRDVQNEQQQLKDQLRERLAVMIERIATLEQLESREEATA